MPRFVWILLVLFFYATSALSAQESQFGAGTNGAKLGTPAIQTFQVGVIITADSGPCRGIVATIPVPYDWPEQKVRIVEEDFSPQVRVTYQNISESARQMIVSVPQLNFGEEARAVLTLEIERFDLLAPDSTDQLVLADPKKMDRETRLYLGPSPYIESRHSKIREIAKQLEKDNPDAKGWQRVELIYDWVREKVEYKDGKLKGALAALKDGDGDCEELTSLFIAICRASDIPARTVWVPGHCYPEFYMKDAEGNGFWFPCQAAGSRAFGGIPEHRPVLQKGDNFKNPQSKERQRYLAENLTGDGGRPKVKFVRKDGAEVAP